ncbi:probable multidrug resistance-associated protein lethal(2)03659 isoform X2 [Metopolophium dirhodum]|uniref:probable multidrug resistance-associated protein lethal(2)03659 isoform X2 n=1 Tax=Metopolophium dirhodum TaxID=44670 RepID=UPI00299018DF|nr:probable multidrug resistance-associated protein lethal(2)03659 isoform X2 [Metopolophium dirhodum]
MYREIPTTDKKVERDRNPRSNANIFEIVTYSWMLNILKTGQLRDLNETDLYTTFDDHTSSSLGDQLEKTWKSELANAYLVNRKPRLLRALIRMFGTKYMLHGFIFCIIEIIFNMSQPLLIGELLAYFNPDDSTNADLEYACLCASGLVFILFISTILYVLMVQECLNEAMKTKIACCSLIYRKTLCLSHKTLGVTTVGQVINLISNDINRFDAALHMIHFLWIGPLQTIVATYFLWQEIGMSSLIGIATFLFFIPLQGWMGKKISEIRLQTAKKTDERIRLMNEIISGIQVIKMYSWEKPFGKLIEYARKMEVEQIKKSTFVGFIWLSFRIVQSRFQLFISILFYIILGNDISIRNVYVLTSFFSILNITMSMRFSLSLLQIGELMVSIKRIQNFLMLEELDYQIPNSCSNSDKSIEDNVEQTTFDNIANNSKSFENNTEFVNSHDIVISKAFAKWLENQDSNTLENINLTVSPGRLVAVIGPVGSGKSSLLQLILRELPISQGNLSVHGVVSYASQEPWLFSGTIQQNILFGSPMEKERYKRVIDICALKNDFEQFPHSDEMVVGERGITLSGGQRARINLARAVYKQADVYLLDDPLSAVDIKVDYLKDKTCILVTHQIQYLSDVDQIVLMDNGHIVTEGSYEAIKACNFDFAKLLGFSEEIKIETSNKTNCNDDALVSSLRGSNKSISSYKCESQQSEALTPKPKEILAHPTQKYDSMKVFIAYITAGGSTSNILFCFLMCIITQVLTSSADLWLSFWVNQEVYQIYNTNNTFCNNSTHSLMILDSFSSLPWFSNFHQHFVIVCALLMVSLIVSVIIRTTMFVRMTKKSSINLHNRMFNSIVRTPMHFFNTNSSGQILNRFSNDIGAIDEILPNNVLSFTQISIGIFGTALVVGLTNIYLLIPTFTMGFIVYKLRKFYFNTSQVVKRLESTTQSPVLAHMNASFQGLTTIRAYKVEKILTQEFDKLLDLHSSASYLRICLTQALGIWLNIINILYTIIILVCFLVIGNTIHGGSVGLALTEVIGSIGIIQIGVRLSAILESQMVSVERVIEYTYLTQENALQSNTNKSPPKEWPFSGKIVFKHFNLRYRPGSPYVLEDLNIQIQPMEKVGIVGRTGAGKSSFIGALFRLALNEGNISIDDIDIHELPLEDLRSKLSIIPQEPVLFSGTLRTNLDPFEIYPDHALWKALDEVELKNFILDLPDGLNSKMSASGLNFSVGQRQLVCLARAIVQNNKILVLDEATANVDPLTDALIQNTIRNKFRFCTVLTIAHRLNTVMDSDRVLVMDLGKIVEFDHPFNLLKNKDGYFYKMVDEMGKATFDLFHSVALERFKTVQLIEKSPNK